MIYWKRGLGNDFPLCERNLLFELAQQANPGLIVNIGVNRGTSLHCLAAGAPDSPIWGIDIQFRTKIFQRDKLSDNIELIEANSTTYSGIMSPVLVLVDGSHEYTMVQGDIENWTRYLDVGGVIAFHDYNPKSGFKERLGGVKRAVDEWQQWADNWQRVNEVGSIVVFERVK